MMANFGNHCRRKFRHGSPNRDDRCPDNKFADTEGYGDAFCASDDEAARNDQKHQTSKAKNNRQPSASLTQYFSGGASLFTCLDSHGDHPRDEHAQE